MLNLLKDFGAVVDVLWQEQARYAVIGGVAVVIYGSLRTTEDMDFLIHPGDVERVIDRLRRRGYRETQGAWTFRDSQLTLRRLWRKHPRQDDATLVDFLGAGLPRHVEIIDRATTEPWRGDCVLRLARKEDLLWLKSFRNSGTDQQDMEFLKHGE